MPNGCRAGMWRTLTRSNYQLTRDRVRPGNQLESLLEDARIKLAACVSDLLGSPDGRPTNDSAQARAATVRAGPGRWL